MKLLAMMMILLSISVYAVIEEHQDLTGPFNTPEEVTTACLQCHEDVAVDLMKTRHWQWLGEEFEMKGKKIRLGKKNMLNNFCIDINSNEPRCNSCHAGYGWADKTFDFTRKDKVDCLACHDNTGTYKKFPTDAGYPVYKQDEKIMKETGKVYKKVDFVKIAQNVGKTKTEHCGTCHFYGGGGMAVKPGDKDISLINATPDIDVHMGKYNMNCSSCHKGEHHKVKGALHASMAAGQNHFSCTDCHKEENFHQSKNAKMAKVLDKHAKTVACETCHIPVVAKKHPTKTWWDWTSAGDKNRKSEKDENGMSTYEWKKGNFVWTKELKPEYYWYNGRTDYLLEGEKIANPKEVVELNPLHGSLKDPSAKISPFKVMRTKQYYDPVTGFLLIPKLFGKGGYWDSVDWDQAFKLGMSYAGFEFSGKYEPVETAMYWPLDHMVATKDHTLKCNDCHGENGRMNWEALGYKGDPKKTKDSRVKQGIVK
ncbi:MAG: tetrathionate reductase family octaheme c-type cytochrome [Candidatus Delongbacteria bacterium]|nr:tetrathionate reductase family octaheme c-type cytochrome [Candidatus Delongbacteria bacterium]MBN2835582.1 tetrathionate reductase family octaheme c-type cytochrome [Candidatus Delongbacteria bacterium]